MADITPVAATETPAPTPPPTPYWTPAATQAPPPAATPTPDPNRITCIVKLAYLDTGHYNWFAVTPTAGATDDDANTWCSDAVSLFNNHENELAYEVDVTSGAHICHYTDDGGKVLVHLYARYVYEANIMCKNHPAG